MSCPIASAVALKIKSRAAVGLKKYGTTCARKDLSLDAWITHLQQELMDGAVYAEKSQILVAELLRENAALKREVAELKERLKYR